MNDLTLDGTQLRYDGNAHNNGRCARLVLSPDGRQLLFVNDRDEYTLEPVGASSYAMACRMAERRASVEGVRLEARQ